MQKPASTNEATPYARAYYDDIKAGSLRSARVVLPLVLDIVAPHSVLDVGCGVGTWLSVCSELGVPDVLGLDGGYVEREQLFIAPDRFVATDLEQPIDLDRRFDLAMSLEVAEHLAPAAADAFVASLVRHADVVLFSAAIPEQGGAHHVNEQWPAYWAARFAAHGYLPADVLRPSVWLDDRVEAWYAQNVLLYLDARRLVDLPTLAAGVPAEGVPLPLVHPRIYDWFTHWSPKGYAPLDGASESE